MTGTVMTWGKTARGMSIMARAPGPSRPDLVG